MEVLIATAVTAMVVGTLIAVTTGVQRSYSYTEAQGAATQHARVVLDRITRAVQQAHASEQFPAVLVLAQTQGTWRFPDTLVVWRPTGTATDPDGLPRYNEVVVYSPDSYLPNQLTEYTFPNDTRTVPATTNTAQWNSDLATLRQSNATKKVVLIKLLRICSASDTGSTWRGAVRFESRLRPSDTQWQAYRAGTLAWKDINWPQGNYGSTTGLRQAWVRTEIQLVLTSSVGSADASAQSSLPFFGSAANYSRLKQ